MHAVTRRELSSSVCACVRAYIISKMEAGRLARADIYTTRMSLFVLDESNDIRRARSLRCCHRCINYFALDALCA